MRSVNLKAMAKKRGIVGISKIDFSKKSGNRQQGRELIKTS
jgi:hypothetical protein